MIHVINLVSIKINRSLLQHVTGANDPDCTWVESDHIEMKPGVRVKVHLQVSVDNAQPVKVHGSVL